MYNFTICVGLVWVVIRYVLFEKQTFNNGLLKVFGKQINFNYYIVINSNKSLLFILIVRMVLFKSPRNCKRRNKGNITSKSN